MVIVVWFWLCYVLFEQTNWHKMSDLRKKSCVPCLSKAQPLNGIKIKELTRQLSDGWQVIHDHHLKKIFVFKNFSLGLKFVNAIGEVAEKEKHHPDVYLSYSKVEIELFTHAADRLTENDFILASKIDALYETYHT